MNPEPSLQAFTRTTIERISQEYADLVKTSSFSIQKLLNPPSFTLEEYCKGHSPHPESEELIRLGQAFGERYRIWIPTAKHYITCSLWTYPAAHFEMMLIMMNCLSIDFYLNDVMGRDTYKNLASDLQYQARKMISRMTEVDHTLSIPSDASPIEIANVEILKRFRETSPKEWFDKNLKLWNYHLDIAHRNGNAAEQGTIPGIAEYIENRPHLGGMPHSVHWIEYAYQQFLDWPLFKNSNLHKWLNRLHEVIAAFGVLSNDLFSFEKEVIDNESDSNLVMVIVLNNPGFSLVEAISYTAGIVRSLLTEYLTLLDSVKEEIRCFPSSLEKKVNSHIECLEKFTQACWAWQVHTKRYKRIRSIWDETRLVDGTH